MLLKSFLVTFVLTISSFAFGKTAAATKKDAPVVMTRKEAAAIIARLQKAAVITKREETAAAKQEATSVAAKPKEDNANIKPKDTAKPKETANPKENAKPKETAKSKEITKPKETAAAKSKKSVATTNSKKTVVATSPKDKGECGSGKQSHGPQCCGCPRKGGASKVKALTDVFLTRLFTDSIAVLNLIDLFKLQVTLQDDQLFSGQNLCCAATLNLEAWNAWLGELNVSESYPVYVKGEDAYETRDGCVVVPLDWILVSPFIIKSPLAPPQNFITRAYKLKVTWCPSEGCNWKVSKIDQRSFACLNTTPFACPI